MNRLFFDIETLANPENIALMPEPKAPGNLKDPEKIATAIEAKRLEQIEQAALDPDYGKVLSIGMCWDMANVHVFTVAKTPEEIDDEQGVVSEAGALEAFWANLYASGGHCVGYNILSFDIPFLLRRSMALGVEVPIIPNLAKFRTEPVTDLMAILYNWGAQSYKGLKLVAKLYGLPVEAPEVDGSMVKGLTPEELYAYQVSDVKLVVSLFNKMNGVYFKL